MPSDWSFSKKAVPKVSRIAVLWNADDRAMTLRYREIERAARILRVAVQELPVEQPTRYYLLLNVKTAETLGLTIPPSLLLRADELIQ